MKKFLILCLLTTSLFTTGSLKAQTTYTVTSSSTYSANKIPLQCSNCTINIADGATLTIDQDIYLQNTAFIGGSKGSSIVVDSKKVTFWSNGSFENVTATFKNTASMVNSGTISLLHSSFVFSNTSYATVYTSIILNSSSWKFTNNAYMEATGGTFSLTVSTLTAGDGLISSHAYIKFNGASVSLNDNTSFLTVANYNNYYFNWSNYNANGTSITTANNKMNCGTSAKNACSAPSLYGPATLSAAGTSSSAILPVKLSAFAVKSSGSTVNVSWTTDQELNSDYFSIERSMDGSSWTSIGKVAARGNTSIATNYAFTDASSASGTTNYRLKMVDMDGAFEYSSIKIVKMAASETREITIYPNPATDYVVISSKTASNAKVQLLTMNGQVVKQVNTETASFTLPLNEFRAGNYLVRVSGSTGGVQTFKLLIVK